MKEFERNLRFFVFLKLILSLIFVDGEEMERRDREERIREQTNEEELLRRKEESWTRQVIFEKDEGYHGHFICGNGSEN